MGRKINDGLVELLPSYLDALTNGITSASSAARSLLRCLADPLPLRVKWGEAMPPKSGGSVAAIAIAVAVLASTSLAMAQISSSELLVQPGSIAPLPAPIEISHRPMGRVEYRSTSYVGDLKLIGKGFITTEADGDALRLRYSIESIEFADQSQSIDIPIGASYRVRVRRDGEHIDISQVDMAIPESSPVSRISARDWQVIKDKLLPVFRQAMEQVRIQSCVFFPRFPGNKAGNDTAVTHTSRADLIRLDLECRTAAGDKKAAIGLKLYRDNPSSWIEGIDRRIREADLTIDIDLRVKGTAKVEGHEFLVISGGMTFAGRGLKAAETFGIAVPAGASLDSFDGMMETQILIDPYSGAVERLVWSERRSFVSAPGSTPVIPSPQLTRGSYRADIPRLYAIAPSPPPRANVAVPSGRTAAVPAPAPRAQQEPKSLVSLYRETINSVFTVRTDTSLGTAFAAGGNVLITARHVVKDAKVVDLENTIGQRFKARVLLPAADVDIAYLVPTTPQRLAPLALAADAPPIGTKLVVIGSPVGLDGTLTTGTVSQLRPYKGRLFLQFEGFVTKGNSGGPIMDLEGKVLGIVMAQLPPEMGIGLNFGVSAVDVLGEAPREARALIAKN